MTGQIVQVAGALLILIGFAGAQFGKLSTKSPVYLVLNLVGSAILTILAFLDRQWGFFILEGVWAVVSLVGLVQVLRRKASSPPGHR